ncbi:MAG TPA: hypothetical protein VE909_04400 [Xanthobacteraceae bacterium]|nr:hypothetical protein [Xanthobacteraceae bacterium]
MDTDAGSKVARERELDAKVNKKEQDRALDLALEETFPGSDPVNVIQPPKSPLERRHEKSKTQGGRSA